ncbi:MAG: GNAT family N-acetyltransferase, partial [Dehalococcoidia bacterium]
SGGSIGLYRRQFIDAGVWYGVFEDGRLVSISGTQAISPAGGVAYLGPTFTHPEYRGRGYAAVARTARNREVLEQCSLAVGTVDAANTSSLRGLLAMGDLPCGHVLETRAYRRDMIGLASLLRRFLARRRAKLGY